MAVLFFNYISMPLALLGLYWSRLWFALFKIFLYKSRKIGRREVLFFL